MEQNARKCNESLNRGQGKRVSQGQDDCPIRLCGGHLRAIIGALLRCPIAVGGASCNRGDCSTGVYTRGKGEYQERYYNRCNTCWSAQFISTAHAQTF